ncbi:kinase-like protein [Backusella circina FSU 941]|nr:kinase-like protein [Backusella circina FSU 941]
MHIINLPNVFRSKRKPKINSTEVEVQQLDDEVIDEESIVKKNTPKITREESKQDLNTEEPLNGIGDYIFQGQLGVGKFSKVMLATHYYTGQKVAVKMINKRVNPYKYMIRLVREINLMEILYHEHIVQLYETYETADTLYLIMEYAPGGNLEEYLKTMTNNGKKALSEDQARDIFRQLMTAVDHCHSRWVVHRDLKAPNVLLDANKNMKLADFGLGNRFGLHRLLTKCGSKLYYSPEMVSPRSYIGPEVDCWCLGVLLFRMTAGDELFGHAKTSQELKTFIMEQEYTLPSHMSPELQDTIRKCLSGKKYERLSIKACLEGDTWVNKGGELPDVFTQNDDHVYHARHITSSYAEYGRAQDTTMLQAVYNSSRLQCRRDLEEESKRNVKVPRTVIYHVTNPSTYYTGTAPYSSKQPIDIIAQDYIRSEMNKNIVLTLQQVNLHHIRDINPTELRSPISQIFQKLKRTEPHQLRKASSALSLPQIYHRGSKDHISFFTIQCNVPTGSSTTVVSGHSGKSGVIYTENRKTKQLPVLRDNNKPKPEVRRLTHHLSMRFISASTPDMDVGEQEKKRQNRIEMIKIIRSVCELLGITFYQSSSSQLSCLLTLQNRKAIHAEPHQNGQHDTASGVHSPESSHSLFRSRLFHSSDRLSDLNKRHGTAISSNISKNSDMSFISASWWGRQVNKISRSGSTSDTSNNSHDVLSMGATNIEDEILKNTQEQNNADNGYVLMTIDVSFVPSPKDEEYYTLAVRYSKKEGSDIVFKLAKGWIQMMLLQKQNNINVTDVFSTDNKKSNVFPKYHSETLVCAS